ncbi:MAG: AraC-like DNA-binding protein [Oceanicoccus sp.]|jgi:AraC-like DNA-binding protein
MEQIPNHYLRACLGGIDDKASIVKLLDDIGIPQFKYHQTEGYITREQYMALVREIWKVSNDEFFGLTRQRCKTGMFAIMAKICNQQASLRAVYETWVNLYSTVREDIAMELSIEDGVASISFSLSQPELDKDHFLSEFTLVTLHRFGCWLTGKPIPLQNVSLAYAKPSHHSLYPQMFNCEIEYDQSSTTLSFDADYLSLPLVRNQRELNLALKTAPMAFLEIPIDHSSYSNRTKAILLSYFKQKKTCPNLGQTATSMAVSERTLRRKLKVEGESFQDIKDEIRKDIAIDKLKRESLSLEDIAAQLGFAEQSTFARSFKRWTKVSPAQYRDQHMEIAMSGTNKPVYSIYY